jgi:hypothetical protein
LPGLSRNTETTARHFSRRSRCAPRAPSLNAFEPLQSNPRYRLPERVAPGSWERSPPNAVRPAGRMPFDPPARARPLRNPSLSCFSRCLAVHASAVSRRSRDGGKKDRRVYRGTRGSA